MTLSRMHEAGLIAHPFRGKYTTLEQDYESKQFYEKARQAHAKSFPTDASDAIVTSDANTTDSPKKSSD